MATVIWLSLALIFLASIFLALAIVGFLPLWLAVLMLLIERWLDWFRPRRAVKLNLTASPPVPK